VGTHFFLSSVCGIPSGSTKRSGLKGSPGLVLILAIPNFARVTPARVYLHFPSDLKCPGVILRAAGVLRHPLNSDAGLMDPNVLANDDFVSLAPSWNVESKLVRLSCGQCENAA